MIPIRLELHNFLPYRAPDPLVFEGIHLACLTGSNGAGKSSILDAITWALWGKARAKRDEELIHLGQTDMMVQLDFEQEGSHYRVIRKRNRRGRTGTGTLDFMILVEGKQPTILNEPGLRQTQDKINEILRLDYDTFIHSAFLQQGRADAFTTKSPAERKRILSDILGLDQWSVYEDQVKEILKNLTTEIGVIQMRLNEIDTELAKEPQYRKDLAHATATFDEAQTALLLAQEQLDAVAHAPKAYQTAIEQESSYERRMKEYQSDIYAAQSDIDFQLEKIEGYQSTVDQSETINEGYQQLQAARDSQSELAEKLSQMSNLDKQYSQLEKDLAAKQAQLESDKRGIESQILELERQIKQGNESEFENAKKEEVELLDLEAHRNEIVDLINSMKEERSGLKATLDALEAEGLTLKDRLENLEIADGATCPLCGQPLDAEHRAELLVQISVERDEKRELYRQHRERTKEITSQSKTHQAEVDEWGLQLKNLPALQKRVGALEEQMASAKDAEIRLHKAQADLNELVAVLTEKSFGTELREQLAQVDAQRQGVGYDPDSHENVKSKLATFKEFESQQTLLEIAKTNLPEAQKALENAQNRLNRVQNTIHTEQAELATLKQEIESLKVQVAEERERRNEVNRLRTERQSAETRKISAEQQITSLQDQRKRKLDLTNRLHERQYEQGIYNELRLAFGKNGVPAMVIETAIPELEAEANELLSRMTDGRMHLRLNTQREKITGGVTETLDIEIADELGTRAYEMYSGGEAFRINFAIRIALSKMLARRAGAHLRTLFIDEGFGSQDDDGRNKLVEAITAIQRDFDLILVITHIDELRDSFPVHVMVDKTANGSMVTIR